MRVINVVDRLFSSGNPYYVSGNPYNWRTFFRVNMPWYFQSLFKKGKDCSVVHSKHNWFRIDDDSFGCYNCRCEFTEKELINNAESFTISYKDFLGKRR